VTAVLLLGAVAAGAAGKGKDTDEDNPHEKMVRSKSVCIDCHTRVPKAGEHAADYFLVDAPSENCLGCHSESEHVGAYEHLGHELEKDAAPAAAKLPLDEHGKIACFTCHDPHPDGVLAGRKVHRADVNESTKGFIAARSLPAGVERRKSEAQFGALLRLPMANGEGCWGCHASKEEVSWKKTLLPGAFMRVLPR
jgi:hypothetical protein